MKIYHYDPITKHYAGEGVADKSPLENEVWLIPANATMNTVPAMKPDERAVWAGTEWKIEQIPTPVNDPEEQQKIINAKARSYLKSTDWYIIRHAETGAPIPQDILDARSEARFSIVE